MNIIIFGAPGVGKGTQADMLCERLGFPHISTGAIFRAAKEAGKELGLLAQKYVDEGLLVPDEVTTAIALEALNAPECAAGFILDGYPRNCTQAESLTQALEAQGRSIDHVVYLVAPPDELLARMLKRGRLDDTEEVIRTRMLVYEQETAPVLDYFRKLDSVLEVFGVGEIAEVNERIIAALETEDATRQPRGLSTRSGAEG